MNPRMTYFDDQRTIVILLFTKGTIVKLKFTLEQDTNAQRSRGVALLFL